MSILRPTLIALLLASALFFSHLSAQNPAHLDSLRIELEAHPKPDKKRLEIMMALGNSLMNVDPVAAAAQARATIHLADSLNDPLQKATGYNQMGNILRNQNENGKAIEYYFDALEIFEAEGDREWESNLHANIGNIYLSMGKLDDAMREEQTALQIRKEIGYYEKIAGIYNTFGNVYAQKQELDSALYYYTMAYDSAEKHGNRHWAAMFLGNIGNVYGRTNNYKLSREKSREAFETHKELGMVVDQARDLHNIGYSFDKESRFDSAAHYYKRSYDIAESFGMKQVMFVSSKGLMECYFKLGRHKLSSEWAKLAVQAQDSFKSQQIARQIQSAENIYKIDKEEMELKFQQDKDDLAREEILKRNRILSGSAGTGFVLISLFAVVLFMRYREKQAYNQKLEGTVEERTAQLVATNVQLKTEVSAKELAQKDLNTFIHRASHDLKGPLASILGLADVAGSEADPKPYLGLISGKVTQLDSVLRQLIDKVEVGNREMNPVEVDWERLKNEVEAELKEVENRDKVQLEWEEKVSGVVSADPFMVKLILKQLIRNAIQFRDPEKEPALCMVRIEGVSKNWRIIVEDNGIGIPQVAQKQVFDMFYSSGAMAEGSGLGLYIVKETVQRMRGKIDLFSKEGIGSRFMLEF